MAAAMEYEVREEYREYTIGQLLDAPVTCFQGVGDIQSELLERYFKVTTVKQLADMAAFIEALAVQETVLEGGERLNRTVADAGPLNFHIRPTDHSKKISELPEAPVHVLDGLTPGQDLALYDAFRITSMTHLAQNRIMLEAKIIDYLSRDAGEDDPSAGQDAIASILGQRAATAAAGQQRALSGDFTDSRMADLAGEVSSHVRDRVEAMRGRAMGSAASLPGREGAIASSTGGLDRVSSVRETRGRGGPGGRGADMDRIRGGGVGIDESRTIQRGDGRRTTADILASRSPGGMTGDSAGSISDRRAMEGAGRRPGGSRTDSVTAARSTLGRTAPPMAATGGAYVKTPTKAKDAKEKETKEREAAILATEEEAAKAEAVKPPPPQPRLNPMVMAAAGIAAVVVIALIIFFLTRGGEPAPDAADQSLAQQQAQQGAAATAPTDTSVTEAPPPPRIKSTHTVGQGDSLWRISIREYSDPLNWPSIFMENQDQIRNPDLIHPAQEFRIPNDPEYRFPAYPEGYRRSR